MQYGQQTSNYLETIANSGVINYTALEQAYYSYYKPTGPCGDTNVCYWDASTKEFMANMEAGQLYVAVPRLQSHLLSDCS